MPRKIFCEKCSSSLNVPDHVLAGKRLKCPKCDHRFVLTTVDASSESTFAGPLDADTASLPAMPVHYGRPPSSGGAAVPAGRFTPAQGMAVSSAPLSPLDGIPVARADGDLREAFDLPLSDARTMERGQAADMGLADVAALLQERPVANRRVSAADARSTARRCKHCGGGIPKGMSLCGTCGLDQESGQVFNFDEDLMPKTAPRSNAPPVHVSIVGGICAVASLILTIASLVQSGQTENPYYHYSWLVVGGVAGYTVYAAVQFLRGKTAKVLILALTLCAVVNAFGLIVMPVVNPWIASPEEISRGVESNDADTTGIVIKSVQEALDLQKIKIGVALLLVYAGASVYLMSMPVKRYINLRIVRDAI